MPHSRAYSSARDCSRLATATRSTFGDAFAPGITFRLMSAVEMIPHVVTAGRSIASDGEARHALHRSVGRSAARGAGREGGPLGLRRARARVLGRPFRGR